MEHVQFLTNNRGERTGLLLDFTKLRNQTEESLEELEDLIICELRKNTPKVSWKTAKEMLKAKQVID